MGLLSQSTGWFRFVIERKPVNGELNLLNPDWGNTRCDSSPMNGDHRFCLSRRAFDICAKVVKSELPRLVAQSSTTRVELVAQDMKRPLCSSAGAPLTA